MPTVQANPNVVDMMDLHHIVPPLNIKVNEEFYYTTPEEDAAIAEAEAEIARGEYYLQRDDETIEQFVERMLREGRYNC